MLCLDAAQVREALPMREAVAAVRAAYVELSGGSADVPARHGIRMAQHQALTLVMPGYLAGADALAVKVVGIHDANPGRGLARIQGVLLLLDAPTGVPLAVMDAAPLTAIRTGASSAVATELLARKQAGTVAILGAGVQARAQLLGICAVRPIRRALIYARSGAHVVDLIAEMQAELPGVELAAAESASVAVQDADIVCCATDSSTPVFDGRRLKAGAHVNGVGSYAPAMQEVDFTTIRRAAKVVVDSRASALAEAGDLIQAITAGVIAAADLYAEVGEVAAGRKPGRESEDEITFFKSVGHAALDVAAASRAYRLARQRGLGTEVRW
jgi:ornithine cyclodeaminase/alanine dehydrogenase-like protein (mu-crystallin family)